MSPFIFFIVLFLVVATSIGIVYSRQRRSDTYDLEGTRKSTSGGADKGLAGTGGGGGG